MDYVKDGTLTIQARTIKEVNSIDRVVVYADGCEREYLMPLPEEQKEGEWIPYLPKYGDMYKCSECKVIIRLPFKPIRMPYNYCPNCGARMYEDDKDIYVPNKGE